jgi:hypothetical protein
VIQYDVFTVGAGYLDIQAALADTSLATLPAQSPAVDYDPATGSVYFVNNGLLREQFLRPVGQFSLVG